MSKYEVLRTAWRNARVLFPIVWREAPGLVAGQAAILLLQAVRPALGLLITRELVNLLATLGSHAPAQTARLVRVIALQVGLEMLFVIVSALSNLLNTRLNQRIEFSLNSRLALKAAAVPLKQFDRPGFFDELQRARSGTGRSVSGWLDGFSALIRQIVTIGSTAVILGQISIYLALALFAILVPFTVIQFQFGGARLAQFRELTPTVRRADYYAELMTSRAAAKEVRLFGLPSYLHERYRHLFWQNADAVLALRRNIAGGMLRMDSLGLAAAAGVLGVAIFGVMPTRQVTPGDYLIVVQSILSMRGTAQALGFSISGLLDDFLTTTDLLQFLEVTEAAEPTVAPGHRFPTQIKEGLTARGISFRYPHADRPSLHDVSFQIRPGERVALVGENGSGKSTLVKCLLGLYQVDAGTISVDGIPMDQIAPDSIRANMTAVFQDFVAYQLTARENVTFGCLRKAGDEERIRAALRKSGAMEFVDGLKDGLETELGNRFSGVDLSIGQWQKVAVARGFFGDGQVIVLDEPTASLDPRSEALLYEKFAELTKDKTSILVSHRLGICPMADRILVLKQGRLVEQGTHAELMALGGEYARMYALQASWYTRDAQPGGRGGTVNASSAAS